MSKAKKIISTIGNVLLYILIAIAIFVLVISIIAKKDSEGTATIFGHQMRFVQSSSMEAYEGTDVSNYKIKSIKVKSCVFIETIPEDEAERDEWLANIKVGDVLTIKYVYTKQETITHRVTKIEPISSGGYKIYLEGDNKGSENSETLKQVIDTSNENSKNYIIGKVVGQSYLLGLLIYAFRSTLGIILLIIVPSIIMIIFQVIRIINVLNIDKKEKQEKAIDKQNKEIEELKRQLEELKNKPNDNTNVSDDVEGGD